jgi:hypothetical protein
VTRHLALARRLPVSLLAAGQGPDLRGRGQLPVTWLADLPSLSASFKSLQQGSHRRGLSAKIRRPYLFARARVVW